MQSHLTLLVLSILCLSIEAQNATNTNATVTTVVSTVTTVTSTVAPVTSTVATATSTEMKKVTSTATIAPTTITMTTQHITVPVNTTASTPVPMLFGRPYSEPPPHPRGYCMRTRAVCSRVRRCCKGPCNLSTRRCP